MKENVSVHHHKSHSLSPLCPLLDHLCHTSPIQMLFIHTHCGKEKKRCCFEVGVPLGLSVAGEAQYQVWLTPFPVLGG